MEVRRFGSKPTRTGAVKGDDSAHAAGDQLNGHADGSPSPATMNGEGGSCSAGRDHGDTSHAVVQSPSTRCYNGDGGVGVGDEPQQKHDARHAQPNAQREARGGSVGHAHAGEAAFADEKSQLWLQHRLLNERVFSNPFGSFFRVEVRLPAPHSPHTRTRAHTRAHTRRSRRTRRMRKRAARWRASLSSWDGRAHLLRPPLPTLSLHRCRSSARCALALGLAPAPFPTLHAGRRPLPTLHIPLPSLPTSPPSPLNSPHLRPSHHQELLQRSRCHTRSESPSPLSVPLPSAPRR
eukprot:1606761-Pleurochrysis_carterae.AAC.1